MWRMEAGRSFELLEQSSRQHMRVGCTEMVAEKRESEWITSRFGA